jgi:hypothetical protein
MCSGSTPSSSSKDSDAPDILTRWGLTVSQLTSLVDMNPSLRGIMLGYVAELKFQELIERCLHVSGTHKHDDHSRKEKHDRVITYKGEPYSIEVKSLQTNLIKQAGGVWRGRTQVDASDRRKVKLPEGGSLVTTLLIRGEFDILAVNCFAFRNRWDFAFALNRDLPTSSYKKYSKKQQRQLIASLIPVAWPPEPPFCDDVVPLLEKLRAERTGGTSASLF